MLDYIVSRLQRTTNSTVFIPQVDGLRFIAIFSVVLLHINGFITNKAPFIFDKSPQSYGWFYYVLSAGFGGHKAVLLFFVISGFILSLPFAKYYWQEGKPVNLKSYFLRRLTRLEPPYIVNMVTVTFLLIWFGNPDFFLTNPRSLESLLPNLAASLAYVHNLVFPKGFSVNAVAWSLEIEVQFYILMPLFVQVLRLEKKLRRFFICIAIVVLVFLQHAYPTDRISLFNFIQYFFLGFLLADLYLNKIRLNIGSLVSFFAGMGVLLSEMSIVDIYSNIYFEFVFIIFIFIFCFLVLTDAFWIRIFSLKPLTVIGGMCYSIYLWHDIVISAVGRYTIYLNISYSYPIAFFWHSVILLLSVLFFSALMFLFIEKPCMDRLWPHKFFEWAKKLPQLVAKFYFN